MAEIVLGIGCAHTPQLFTPAGQWEIRAKRDTEDGVPLWYRGRRLTYDELEAARGNPGFAGQMVLPVREERLARSHAAIARIADVLADAAPDVVIIFGNDQNEMYLDDIKPAFTIMGADEFRNMPRTDAQTERLPPGIALSDTGHLPDDDEVVLPGHPALAEHLAAACTAAGFDVAYSRRQVRANPARAQTSGMPHAYGFVYKQLFRGRPLPNVPVDTNTFYPPNQPTAGRCLAFGKAIGRAIEAWNCASRVAVVASGGLSHFVVDEEFDRDIMKAMACNDFEQVAACDEGYFQAGSSEIKSWIAAGGALTAAGLKGEVVEYQPLYRTPAGTGSSAAFMLWC
jgi:hypothetical protein